MNRRGIAAAGNFIIDRVKVIDQFPHREGLGNILSETPRNGGSSYNVLKNFAKLGIDFPLTAIGKVGKDDFGKMIAKECQSLGIDTDFLGFSSSLGTSYTDVMTENETGKRTFFHYRGANSELAEHDIPLEQLEAKILHLGYLLLLDQLDLLLPDGKTVAAVVLEKAQKQGLLTSVDLVSEASDRFRILVPPALPFIDFLFLNEYEAGKTVGFPLVDAQGVLVEEKALKACDLLLKQGVKKWVILHHAAGALAINNERQALKQVRLKVPPNLIKGSAGAGDAFAAGVLAALHNEENMQFALELGTLAAASSLFDASCSESILPIAQLGELKSKYGWD